jgi:hypothetical protein
MLFDDKYDCEDYDFDQEEDFEPEPDYDAINAERALAEWEASRPVMVIQNEGCELEDSFDCEVPF